MFLLSCFLDLLMLLHIAVVWHFLMLSSFHRVDTPQFVPADTDGHLGRFQFLLLCIKLPQPLANTNVCGHVFSFLLGKYF